MKKNGGEKKKRVRTKGKGMLVRVPRRFKKEEPKLIFAEPPRRNVEDDALEPDDKIAKHKYPPPRKDKVFREKWALFIDNVTSRKNFHMGHLETLRILCDCFMEYEQLRGFLAENGQSYCAVGRQGEQWKMYPHVQQLNRVKESISVYSKMLDLIVKKDEGMGGDAGDGEDWK